MALLTKASILAAEDLRTQLVQVPEWGGEVKIRTMTGADRDAFDNSLLTMDEKGNRRTSILNMRAKLVALTVVDDAGEPMFTLAEVEALSGKSAAALDRVVKAAQTLNAMGIDGIAAAEKNLGPEPSAGSTSG